MEKLLIKENGNSTIFMEKEKYLTTKSTYLMKVINIKIVPILKIIGSNTMANFPKTEKKVKEH